MSSAVSMWNRRSTPAPAAEILALRRQFDHARIIWLQPDRAAASRRHGRAIDRDVGDEAAVLRPEPKGARPR